MLLFMSRNLRYYYPKCTRIDVVNIFMYNFYWSICLHFHCVLFIHPTFYWYLLSRGPDRCIFCIALYMLCLSFDTRAKNLRLSTFLILVLYNQDNVSAFYCQCWSWEHRARATCRVLHVWYTETTCYVGTTRLIVLLVNIH